MSETRYENIELSIQGRVARVTLNRPAVGNALSAAFSLARAISHMDADQLILTHMSEDFGEAMSAFAEKRKPVFKGE